MPRRLYQDAILAEARKATGAGAMPDADVRVTVDNPLCGDRVTLELRLARGTIDAIRHKVRGCVLCQAAASVIARKAPGTAPDRLAEVEDAVRVMLRSGSELPPVAWPELRIFRPVAEHRSRHECVLLPLVALRRAIVEAGLGPPPAPPGTPDNAGA